MGPFLFVFSSSMKGRGMSSEMPGGTWEHVAVPILPKPILTLKGLVTTSPDGANY
jgi:hypothetical protein